jgi:preprotein translocase subunit SecB
MVRFVKQADLQKAGRVARAFSLQEIELSELHASRLVSLTKAPDVSFHISVEDRATASVVNEGKTLLIKVDFKLVARAGEDEASPKLIEIAGVFDLSYGRQLPSDKFPLSDEDAQLFGRVNGVYNAWPYMREVVTSCVSRLGYPPLTLFPLVISPEPKEARPSDDAKKDSESA